MQFACGPGWEISPDARGFSQQRCIISGLELPAFYPILDTAVLGRAGLDLLQAGRSLLEAGARILQLRHKGHFSRELFEVAGEMAAACREAGALFVVNDRADMAALLGCALHLGQEDLRPLEARTILPRPAVIGFSTHNEAQIRAAAEEPVDYLAFGPIFATGSKENPDPVTGLAGLRRIRGLTRRPLVAIGGVTLENAGQVLAAGADSVAVISGFLPELRSGAVGRWVELERGSKG